MFDLFVAAAAGATVVLVPAKASVFPGEVARFMETSEVSIWYSVPSVLTMLTVRGGLKGGEFPALRSILFAGEVFPSKCLRQIMRLLPHVRFYNLYGPTETNVCTFYEVPPLPDDATAPIPIGRSIANVDAFVVGDGGRAATRGEVGELYVRGGTVMQGYWGDDERTAKALTPVPSARGIGGLAYRTGDVVRESDGGTLHLLGRRDAQIKSRGYRIELGEIETALYAHPAVLECAVLPIPDDLVTNRIKAFVVGLQSIDGPALARFCAERIPRYMIPDTFEFRTELPKTSTGKVDRQRLSASSSPV